MNISLGIKNKFIEDIIVFFLTLALALAISCAAIYFSFVKDVTKPVVTCNLKGDTPIISSFVIGSIMISAWFYLKGKSIKALNDTILFSTSAVVAYFYIFNNVTFNKYHDPNMLCQNVFYLSWQFLILICSFSKAEIAFIEFLQERNILVNASSKRRENITHSDKELFLFKIATSAIKAIKKQRKHL